MHKTTVEAIQHVIENSPWKGSVEVFVKPQSTGGFWTMAVHDIADDGKHLFAIRDVGLAIGTAYGEGLSISTKGDWIVFS